MSTPFYPPNYLPFMMYPGMLPAGVPMTYQPDVTLLTQQQSQLVRTERDGWVVLKNPDGTQLYFNTKTKASRREKPDVLKTPEELVLATCEWEETRDPSTNAVMYVNKRTHKSQVEMPEAYRTILTKVESMRNAPVSTQPPLTLEKKQTLDKETIFSEFERLHVEDTTSWESVRGKLPLMDGVKTKQWRNALREYQTRMKERMQEEQREQKRQAREQFVSILHDLNQRKAIDIRQAWAKVFCEVRQDERYVPLIEAEAPDLWKDFVYQEEKRQMQDAKEMLARELQPTTPIEHDEFMFLCDRLVIAEPLRERLFKAHTHDVQRRCEEERKKAKDEERALREKEGMVKDLLADMVTSGKVLYCDAPDVFLSQIRDIALDDERKLSIFMKKQELLKDDYLDVCKQLRRIVRSRRGFLTPFMSAETFVLLYSRFEPRLEKFERKYIQMWIDEDDEFAWRLKKPSPDERDASPPRTHEKQD